MAEGDVGTWSHCGKRTPHGPHTHTVTMNEGNYPDVPCNGTPGLGPEDAVQDARGLLEASGYVVLKRESYRRAQERQRVAEALLEAEKQASQGTRHWANRALDEQNRLADRLTFVYGVARAHGASIEELSGPDTPTTKTSETLKETR